MRGRGNICQTPTCSLDFDPLKGVVVGQAKKPGPTARRVANEDIPKQVAATLAGIFRPSKAYEGPKQGFIYKWDRFGCGYYRDHGNGHTAALMPLAALLDGPSYEPWKAWAMHTEDKADELHVDCTQLGDGRHFTRRAAARNKNATAYISVNGNCSATVETLITTVPPPSEVIAIGVQEMKIHLDDVNCAIGRYRRLGWEASIVPCIGHGNTASAGVALIVRPGISVTPVTSAVAGFHVPTSARFGFWLIEGGLRGGHIIVVAYLHDSIGLKDLNLALLQEIASVLIALGKPYIILADWNITPDVLVAGEWPNGIGGKICEAGRPTCMQGDSCKAYDYAVTSAQWIHPPTATLYEPWAPGPHTAVLFEMPFKQPNILVTAIRKPKTFPAQAPHGPFREDDKPTGDRGLRLEGGSGTEDLADACTIMYAEIERELADKYAVDIDTLVVHKGKATRNPYTGRGIDLGTMKVPIFQLCHGVAGGNQTSCFYRRMNARVREYAFLRDKNSRSRQEVSAFWDLHRSLPSAKPPGDCEALQWRSWKAHTRRGLYQVPTLFLRKLASFFLDRARAIESKLGADRSRKYREWLRRAAPQGDASVYRWIRERPPFVPAPVDANLAIVPYHAAYDAKARVFTDVWEKAPPTHLSGDILWPTDLHLTDFDAPLDPDAVRSTSRCFSIVTSFGTDVIHPRQIGLLSNSLLWFMIDIFIHMIRRGLTAAAVNLILVKLIPKADGGERPIGLFSAFLRVLMKLLRRTVGQKWLQDKMPAHWYGVKGRPSSQAVWSRLIAARYAKATGAIALGSLYDVTKAFDHLVWKAIFLAAETLGFPIILVRFLIHLYGCERKVVVGRGVARTSRPTISVIAGCVFADIMMFLVMYGIDALVKKAAPLAHAAVVADDYQLLVCKPREQAIRIMLRAHAACTRAFGEVGLPISVKKQVLLTSDESAAQDIADVEPALADSRRRTARNLGVDYTLGKRRYTLVFAARVHKTSKKFLKIKAMRSVGIDTSHFVVSLVNSSHTYGNDCIGASPSQVRLCRAAAHRGVTRSPSGRSATLDLALSRAQPTALDPTYRLNSGPIFALTSALWDKWVPRQWILRTWNDAFLCANSKGFSWNSVTDGLLAAAATCKRIAWTSVTPGSFITNEGVAIDCDAVCPRSVRLLADRATETAILKHTVANDNDLRSLGPHAVPWMLPLRRLVAQKPKENWTPLNQSMLRCCNAKGQWPPQRLKDANLIDNGDCYLCGGPGTTHHRAFSCPGRHDFRYNYGLPEHTVRLARENAEDPLWTRAVAPDPTADLPPPSVLGPTWTVLPRSGKKSFNGHGFGDGSGVSPFGPNTTRCGYAVVQIMMHKEEFVLSRCLVGPLPGPIQATPAAEACALLQYVIYAEDLPGLIFYSDCQWVVDCFVGGSVASTGASHVHADLWRRFWKLCDGRLHSLRVEKVKAHVTSKDLAEGYPTFLKDGNGYADAGAKLGRSQHPRNPDLEKSIAKSYVLLQIIARFLARISTVCMEANDDVPPITLRSKDIIGAVTREKAAPVKHAIVITDGRPRCLWCLKSAESVENLHSTPCAQAGGHILWKAGPVIICSRCGAYSQHCTRLLGRPCSGHATDNRRSWLRRVFEKQLHPCGDVGLPPAVLWRLCAPQQHIEPLPPAADDPLEDLQSVAARDPVARLFGYAMRLITDDDVKMKGFDDTEADDKKYADAVKGHTLASCSSAPGVGHVGIACVSHDPEHWDPWTGARVVHPITRGPTIPAHSKLRNRFCLNAGDRERRRFERSRAAETILHDTTEGEHLHDPLPALCPSTWNNLEAAACPDGHEDKSDSDDEDASFWNNLDDTPLDEQGALVDVSQVNRALAEFTLFERTPDENGLAEAILDVIQLVEEGLVTDVDRTVEAVALAARHLGPSEVAPAADLQCEPCEARVERDGLPDEDSIAFLFDGVNHQRVNQRAQAEPALQRLAALRDRVLARLNAAMQA